MSSEQNSDQSFMVKLATFIVDKRNLFFLLTIVLLIFSVFSRNWVTVENDLTEYLPETSETKQALTVMDEEFITYGTADVMVANISYSDAESLCEELKSIKGVQSISFDQTSDHYSNASALYSITFNYSEDDDACLESLDRVKEALSDQDIFVKTDLGNALAETIEHEISIIMVLVAVIVVTVLIFTSQTFGEIPPLLLTFVIAMILNQGSNFLLGTISFVSNSVTSILQLALSLDYAVILCNRFKEEHLTLPVREAAITALSKAIPEVFASSLTTIGGLCAMLFMQFRIGPDMAICLIKSIFYALLSVFVVMPGLLVLFGPLIEKTEHRNFVPKISFVGKYAWVTRFVVPVLFVVVVIGGYICQKQTPYVYGYSSLTTPKLNETQIAENTINSTFTSKNMIAVVVPTGSYEIEAAMIKELLSYDEVDSATGISNVEALDGYMLGDRLTPRQFAEMAGLDYEVAELAYSAYALQNTDYSNLLGSLSAYRVPLIDMFLFVCDQVDSGLITLDADQSDMLLDAEVQMRSAKDQLCGENYSRILVYLNMPVSGDETYAFLDKVRDIAQSYYPDENVYVAGESTNEYDFEKSFSRDNLVVSIVSILIVLVVLLFTFKSAGMPLLLILVIQGSIWINFSFPVFTHTNLFFMSYLVVSSIQMGANIDYAIVIANRYQELKGQINHRQAMIDTLNFAFPTIITSGSILTLSGTLIGMMTSEPTITGIGQSLGRGTILSIFLVLFVLPQILLIGGDIVDHTSFSVPHPSRRLRSGSRVYINGLVSGEIHGTISGYVRASVDGDVSLNVVSGSAGEASTPPAPSGYIEADYSEVPETTETPEAPKALRCIITPDPEEFAEELRAETKKKKKKKKKDKDSSLDDSKHRKEDHHEK